MCLPTVITKTSTGEGTSANSAAREESTERGGCKPEGGVRHRGSLLPALTWRSLQADQKAAVETQVGFQAPRGREQPRDLFAATIPVYVLRGNF